MDLFIDNYNFGIKSVFCSEYGLRHWEKAKTVKGWGSLAHKIIGTIECCPVLGHVVSLIEGILQSRRIEVLGPSDTSLLRGCLNALKQEDRDELVSKLIEADVSSYQLLQFAWGQWAVQTRMKNRNWKHIPSGSGFDVKKLEDNYKKIFNEKSNTFKPFSLTQEIIKIVCDEDQNFSDTLQSHPLGDDILGYPNLVIAQPNTTFDQLQSVLKAIKELQKQKNMIELVQNLQNSNPR